MDLEEKDGLEQYKKTAILAVLFEKRGLKNI